MRKLLLALLSLALSSSVGAQSCCDRDIAPLQKTIISTNLPIGMASSGTVGANGALTLGTAAALTQAAGIWWYFPAGAVFSGSGAGFYYTVMSSTTAGTIYNNTYTPGTDSGAPPASPTAVSDAGPGAYTGVTSETTIASGTVPGGFLGTSGSIYCDQQYEATNNANTKTMNLKFGTTTYKALGCTNTVTCRTLALIKNVKANAQVSWVQTNTSSIGTSTGPSQLGTEDTSSNKTLSITLTNATATNNFIHHYGVCTASSHRR